MRMLVLMVLALATVASARPPCNPSSLAHIADEETRAMIVDAWEQANTARPEEQRKVRKAAGMTDDDERGCRAIKAKKDAKTRRPEHP